VKEVKELIGSLEARRKAVLDKSAPFHAKRDELLKRLHPLEVELRELDRQIKAIEQPGVRDLGNQIAALHRAIGAKTLPNTSAPPPKAEP
jgi:uncharacterized coiled-coil DUF342 family protein